MILNAKIPDSLYQQLQNLSEREDISLDQLVSIALSAQVSAWMTKDYLEEKSRLGNWNEFQEILSKVSNQEPEKHDQL